MIVYYITTMYTTVASLSMLHSLILAVLLVVLYTIMCIDPFDSYFRQMLQHHTAMYSLIVCAMQCILAMYNALLFD
jgi:hypothetical protein